jgi:hypothetical protein
VGTNVQDKLIATHDLDVPWRPADLEQRMGRIVRRGNENKDVKVFRYVTKGTFDAYMWQLIENKQRFISQIMSAKVPTRESEDCDEIVLTAAEIKAQFRHHGVLIFRIRDVSTVIRVIKHILYQIICVVSLHRLRKSDCPEVFVQNIPLPLSVK